MRKISPDLLHPYLDLSLGEVTNLLNFNKRAAKYYGKIKKNSRANKPASNQKKRIILLTYLRKASAVVPSRGFLLSITKLNLPHADIQ